MGSPLVRPRQTSRRGLVCVIHGYPLNAQANQRSPKARMDHFQLPTSRWSNAAGLTNRAAASTKQTHTCLRIERHWRATLSEPLNRFVSRSDREPVAVQSFACAEKSTSPPRNANARSLTPRPPQHSSRARANKLMAHKDQESITKPSCDDGDDGCR